MHRQVIKIDEEKCDGCGQCVTACAEGAIEIVDGKARLISDVYCDGLGACLGDCPQGAITMEEREAAPYDEEAVMRHLAGAEKPAPPPGHGFGGCPGSALRSFMAAAAQPPHEEEADMAAPSPSRLGNWPVQLNLVPPFAPYLQDADVLVCADCVPFAVPDFHDRFLKGRVVLVGCPKLDDLVHYRQKLGAIFQQAAPASLTVLRMQVPCCSGIAQAAVEARNRYAPDIPCDVFIIGIEGQIQKMEPPAFSAR